MRDPLYIKGLTKISISEKEGIIEKNPMWVAVYESVDDSSLS